MKNSFIKKINFEIEILIKFYSQISESREIIESINKGVLVKGSLKHLAEVFSILHEEKVIKNNMLFLDTGSGDGRICALASFFGLKSYGIEFNESVCKQSIHYINQLNNKSVFKKSSRPTIVKGDFFENQAYNDLGISFNSFNIIFNYVTFHEDIVKKIIRESDSHTILILHSPTPTTFSFPNMSLIKKIQLHGIYQVVYIFEKD